MERADKLDHQLDVNENELEGEGDEAQEEVEHKEDEDQKNAKDAEMDEEDANIIPPEITLFDLKTKRLQYLFSREFENFERSLTHFKKTSTELSYKNEIIITFWLAVQQRSFEFACFVFNHQDSEFLRKRCSKLVMNSFKHNLLEEKYIKKILKESDSFAAESNKDQNKENEHVSLTAGHLNSTNNLQVIGGPAAVALKKK